MTATTPLAQRILERIGREGPLTFAEYMRMALYEPGYGYYVTGAHHIGWEGDYYTSTDVSTLFAHCVGRQLYQFWEALGHPSPFHVLEQGAGRGDLAQGVRAWAEQYAPDLHRALSYSTEDINTGHDSVNITSVPPAVTPHTPRPPARGGPTIHDAGATASGEGYHVILSNELVDAFPVHRVMIYEGRLYEIYVDAREGQLYEVLDEPSTPEVAEYLDHYQIPWRSFGEGWQAEINLDAIRWVRQSAARLYRSARAKKGRGFLLVIDYGDKARALYTDYRRSGTLTCYYRHQMNEAPLALPGKQDITAHVNFSALIEEGRRCGLRLHNFTTQSTWLESMGIYEELDTLRKTHFAEADSDRASDKGQTALFQWYNLRNRVAALTSPTGMGNFKVLVMKR
jgi:SAM-dependent MidA family methyltransferase